MEWREWINRRYVEWRGDSIGREGSQVEFARWIGVSHQLMSQWLAGSKPKTHQAIQALVSRYGSEVYEILGLPVPSHDPEMDILLAKFAELTPLQRDEVLQVIEQIQDRDEKQLDRRIAETAEKAAWQESMHSTQAARLAALGDLAGLIEHIPNYLAQGDPQEINRLLHLLLEEIVVHEDRSVELHFKQG